MTSTTEPRRTGRPPGPVRIFRLPERKRVQLLDEWRGTHADVTVNDRRDAGPGAHRVLYRNALVLGVAYTNTGTTTTVLVLAVPEHTQLVAVGTATVESIERPTNPLRVRP